MWETDKLIFLFRLTSYWGKYKFCKDCKWLLFHRSPRVVYWTDQHKLLHRCRLAHLASRKGQFLALHFFPAGGESIQNQVPLSNFTPYLCPNSWVTRIN